MSPERKFPTSSGRMRAVRPSADRRQRGSIVVMVALFLTIAVAALGALDVGNVFFARRSLQRIADLAALAGAQTISGGCGAASTSATANAAANGFSSDASGVATITVACGRWDTKTNGAPSYFASTNAGAPLNALQVTVTRQVPYFFLGPVRTVSATSTAQATNIGAFSVGTALEQLQGGAVNGLLNALLGTNLDLSLVSYESLANARIKIGDLMAAAGVATVDQLLATQVDVAQLAHLMLTALSRASVADANLQTDVATLQTILDGGISDTLAFPLGNTAGAAGLLSLGVSNAQSAVDATISPLDALIVAAEIAHAGQPAIDVTTGVNLGALASATVKVQIVEPPVLAVGEAGRDPTTQAWRTEASAAQVRLYLTLAVANISVPISLEAAQGQAWLVSTNCTSSRATSNSIVGGQTGIANLCIADQAANPQAASQAFSCPTQPATILKVAGIPVVTAHASTSLTGNPIDPPLMFAASGGYSSFGTGVGEALANALSSSLQVDGIDLSIVTSALAPLLAGIADIGIDPLLQLLGVQAGVTTIHDLSLTCGAPTLVY